jgi:hypothetical protein
MVLIGVVWFALSVAGVFAGAAMISGYFLGVGLAFGGLIVSGVYFYRYRRIKKLLQGKDVLAQWANGESQTMPRPALIWTVNCISGAPQEPGWRMFRLNDETFLAPNVHTYRLPSVRLPAVHVVLPVLVCGGRESYQSAFQRDRI